MAEIPLTRGYVAIVDDDIYPLLACCNWHANVTMTGHVYAMRRPPHGAYMDKPTKKIYMHRVIINAPPELVVDHINGDTMDNRRRNLQAVSSGINNEKAKHVVRIEEFILEYGSDRAIEMFGQLRVREAIRQIHLS